MLSGCSTSNSDFICDWSPKNTTEHLWKIDHASQIAFPVVFALLQTLYWTMYLYSPSTVEFHCDNILPA